MSQQETTKPVRGPKEAMAEVDTNLGQLLVVLQRLLPRLDDPERAEDVHSGLSTAAGCLESARKAYEKFLAQARTTVLSASGQPKVESEIVAVIAAAISAMLGQPYKLLSVEPVPTAAPHLNVWALEGRTQIFQSHKIR